jgi:hypothetical protein
MKLRNTLLSGLAALAVAAVGARAQEIDTISGGFNGSAGGGYSNGDLVLAFFNPADTSTGSGVNSQGDLLFNIGTVSSYTGLVAGETYSVAGFNGSATSGQPTVGFGNSELNATQSVPNANTNWAVFGASTSNKELWLTGLTAQSGGTSSTQGTVANQINAIGSGAANVANSDGSAYDSAKATQGDLGSGLNWQNFSPVAATSVSSTSDTLGLYSLTTSLHGGSAGTNLGTFTLTDTAGVFSLTFTAFSAIPEPSTYAAILGALTVGFVLIRRRMSAARLSAVA